MNHNKESQAHAPLAGLFLGMQSSTFESRFWVLLSSRRVRDTSKYGVLPCLRRISAIQSLTMELGEHHTVFKALAVSQSLHGKTEYHGCACTLLI